MKVKKVIFVIISALLFFFMLAVLELNKNTVWGFVSQLSSLRDSMRHTV